MKRLRRTIFNGLTVLSLVLCVATVGLWVRSYWRCNCVGYLNADGTTLSACQSFTGRIGIIVLRGDLSNFTSRRKSGLFAYSQPAFRLWLLNTLLGIEWSSTPIRDPNYHTETSIIVPNGYILSLFSILPLLKLYRGFRFSRLPTVGQCKECGYDLRATPDRCPECGEIPNSLEL